MNILFDSNGLVYKVDVLSKLPDYGDCCADTNRYWHLIIAGHKLGVAPVADLYKLQDQFNTVTRFFISTQRPGLVRAPVALLPAAWAVDGQQEKDLPADQADPWVIANGAWGNLANVRMIYEQQKERWWRYQNGDLPHLHTPNIFARGQGGSPSVLGDGGIYGTVLTRIGTIPTWDSGAAWGHKIQWGDPTDVEDDVNLIHCFIQAALTKTTSVSEAARKLYATKRAVNDGMTYLGEKNPIMGALALYFQKDNTGFVEMYRPIVERIFQ